MSDGAGDQLHPWQTTDLIGHAEAEAVLHQAACSGRLPHAWIFGGPRGIGKQTLAFRFARFLLAGRADLSSDDGIPGLGLPGFDVPETSAAGTSLFVPSDDPNARLVAAESHPDLLSLRQPFLNDDGKPTRDLGIGEARRAAPFLRLTPALSPWRVVIVDDAHLMNRNSANAILKILEEPPSRAVIILISETPGSFLPTIRSRCRRLQMSPLSEDAVLDYLCRLDAEMSHTDQVALARLSEGSIGRAAELRALDGLALYRSLAAMLESLPRLDMRQVHKLADQLSGASAEPAYRTLTGLLVWWLERMVRSLARDVPLQEIVAGEAMLVQRLARTASGHALDHWVEVWEKIARLFARTEGAHLDRRLTIIQAFASLRAAAGP